MTDETKPLNSESESLEPQTGADESGTPETLHDATPVRRKRGRPSNAERAAMNGAAETINSKPTGAKRGPKPKAAKKAYTADEIGVMGRQLVGIHVMVAQITRIPEVAISEEEGQLLAQSIVNVADQYDLALDGKTGAALQLFMTAAMIYGPRAFAVRARAAKAQSENSVPVATVQ